MAASQYGYFHRVFSTSQPFFGTHRLMQTAILLDNILSLGIVGEACLVAGPVAEDPVLPLGRAHLQVVADLNGQGEQASTYKTRGAMSKTSNSSSRLNQCGGAEIRIPASLMSLCFPLHS